MDNKVLRLLFLSLGLSSIVFGRLNFETVRISHNAPPGETHFVAQFPFTNDGNETVEIVEVKSSCGCTVPTLEKKTYAPGESGAIKAVFSYGSRSGNQIKRVTVRSTAGPTELNLQVKIPLKWKIDRRLIRWTPTNQDAPQSINVDFFEGVPLEIETVEINRERFDFETSWSNDGARLTLDIGVKEIDPGGTHRIEIVLRNVAGQQIRIPFYIRLQA